jgi:integrase
MATGFRVKNLKLQSGERLPVLVEAATGVPLWHPTLFALTELRATNRASATLRQATRAVMVAHQVFRHLGVDLEERLAAGRILELGEIEALAGLAGMTQEALDELLETETPAPTASRPRIASLEKVRMRAKPTDQRPQVGAQTKGIRLIYIRDYIAWRVRGKLLKLDFQEPVYRALVDAAPLVVGRLSERIPPSSRLNDLNARQGVSQEVRERTVQVTHPDSPENPWKNRHVRIRNQLIFRWLLELGLRRGELLGIQLGDLDMRSNEVEIARRADDPLEVRKDAPDVKTKERSLALGKELAQLTRDYVQGPRRAIRDARRLPYLFVATGTGSPLTKAALSKLFVELRRKVPGLPEELSPHVLRHTWNDRFSELMDERGVSPDEEEKMRKQQMGWSDNSKMPAVYTKRHIRRKTNEASLAMQAQAFEAEKGKK